MKKFFKNIRKKSPARSGPPAEGSPKLDNRSTASLVIGYDVREKELGKLHKAAWLGDVGKVQQLAKKDPSPLDKEKRTPLHLACAQGHENVVQELLEWKAKTNIGDADSRTPLMKAVECRHEGCVTLLLQDKVELDSVDKDGNTSLHIAACDGSAKIAKMLCQAGASLTIKNREGLAPLHVAVREKHEEVCRIIIGFRGQVDIEDNNLRTPLMYACQDGSINLVRLFLDHGASTVHKDAKGWSADDCAVIQGHHACSQLISDHILRQQRGSAASTPRSTAGSRSATPRGPSPFALPSPSPTDRDSASFGLPAADAGGDDSGDETLSKASARGAGSDSWGDDTDISLAEDKKTKVGASKINLAKLVGHLPSESDDGGSQKTGHEEERGDEDPTGPQISAKRASTKSLQSQSSTEDNSWAAADSPVSTRRTAARVSFKGDKELSEVHDITATESEGESDHYSTIPAETQPGVHAAEGYIPSATSQDSGLQLSPEKHRGPHKAAFMEELGLGDVDDISELSDGASQSKPAVQPAGTATAAASDSEWDSTVKSNPPKPGILKKWSKVDDASDWDTTEADDNPPPLPASPQPSPTKMTEGENVLEETIVLAVGSTIPKEMEMMMRKKQAEAQDSEEEDSSSQHDVKAAAASDLLSVTIEQSAKEYLGNDFLDVTPQGNLLDRPSQDSEWDSATEIVTPRDTTAAVQPSSKEASSDSKPGDERDEDDGDKVVVPDPPISTLAPIATADSQQVEETLIPTALPPQPQAHVESDVDAEEEDESAWDSDDDILPLDVPPASQLDRLVEPQPAGGYTKARPYATSDTDDEMDNTETVSEWELERKVSKEQKQHLQEELRVAEEKRKEEERLQQERMAQEEEARQREEAKKREEEEEGRRREEERQWQESQEEEPSGQHGDHEEVVQRGQLRVDAEEDLQPVDEMAALNSCQNNSRLDANTVLSVEADVAREELKQERESDTLATKVAVSSSSSVLSAVNGYGSLQPQQSQGMPQSSSSSYLAGPTALQIKQRLQIGTTPTMYQSDGMESDDSLTSDNDRNEVPSSYPALLGSTQSFRPDFNMADDDVLSYTSTEFEGSDAVLTSASPFARDVLLNMNLSDPSTLVKVQDYIRETKRHMEQERNQRVVLENKLRVIVREKQELQRKLESITEAKQSLEQNKLDLEAHVRSLEYNLSEELEKKRNAELLLSKTKEQLIRKEQQFTNELEAKQRAELTMRNIQLEMRAAQNTIKELEEEREELERQLQHEHSARKLQEQINEEQSRLAHQQHQETMATSTAAASRRDLAAGDDSEVVEERSDRDKLNAELYALKMEMDRQRSRFKDEITLMATENEELQSRVDELKSEMKLNEEALAHATMQYNVQLGNLRSEAVSTVTALEKERATREKLETELDSLQNRLLAANMEKDKAVNARNDLERDYHMEKQAHLRFVERKEDEVNMLKDNNQHLNQRLNTMENKLSSVENELHVSSTSLMERTNQLQQLRQELEKYKSAQTTQDTNIRLEKEHNAKLQMKIESLQERLSQSQHEVMSLKQQVESLRSASLNATPAESHEHLSTVINSLRSDSDRTKAMLEERNNSLVEQVQRLKEELRNAENRCNTLDSDLRRLQSQHMEVTHKLSFAEAQLQLLQKGKEQLERERAQLKVELDKANDRHRLAQEKCLESQARLSELTDRLDHAERTSQLSTQHLATTAASFTAVTRSKDEVEDTVKKLQVENSRLEAELRHEQERTEMLQAELADSQKVRSSLEALCSNLKSATAHLEEKLGGETASRVVLAQEAKDSKTLLEQELAARSKLGLRIAQLERAQKTAQTKLQQAKTQGSNADEQKAAVEAQLLEECQRNQQLQKEVSNLKAHLKAAKKKIKSQVNSGPVDMEALQQELEMKYRRDLNSKLQEVNSYLESQARARDHLDTSRSENETRLAAEKQRLEEENSNLRLQYEQAVAQRESREVEARRFKQLYESEMQWRMRLSDQLQFSSDKALHLKPHLVSDNKNRFHSSLSKSVLSEASHINGDYNEALSNKIQAELDRSIAKHLEAAPHRDIVPVVRGTEDALLNHSLARSSKDYIDILKRKYHVP